MKQKKLDYPPIRDDGLQLEENRPFQERFWVAERIAWAGFAVIVLVALLGLTGAGGPLSRQTTTLSGGTLESPRIARWGAPDQFVATLLPGAGERSIVLSPAFQEAYQVEGIYPEPQSSQTVAGGGTRLAFAGDPDGRTPVVLSVKPNAPGLANVTVGMGEASASISSFILP